MAQSIAAIALLVREYDEAIAWFVERLGFVLVEDSPRENGKRWVVVAPPGGRGASILLARAATPQQRACVGNQTGGRVFLFLHTDGFRRDYESMCARGVRFVDQPQEEPYGTVAVFLDLYGNR